MCDVTLAIGLISTAVSTVGGIMQQRAQADAAQAAANYNSQVAANEAATRQQLAQAEMAKAAEERNRVIRAGLSSQGELRNNMGASGFVLDSGTNLSLLGQSAEEIQQDASAVTQKGTMAAWEHLARATGAENQASFARYEAKNSGVSPLAIAGTVLGGVAGGLNSYYNYAGNSGGGSGSDYTLVGVHGEPKPYKVKR